MKHTLFYFIYKYFYLIRFTYTAADGFLFVLPMIFSDVFSLVVVQRITIMTQKGKGAIFENNES